MGRLSRGLALPGLFLFAAVAGFWAGCARDEDPPDRPTLLLFITVDQLRGDMPARSMERVPDGGFGRLAAAGVWLTDAHYAHGSTQTCPGYATLATGASPAQHGIVANRWLEAGREGPAYCLADAGHALLGEETPAGAGTSPRNLLGSTFVDELVLAGRGRSRAWSVALKDRAAILPAGRAGKAAWYSPRTGRFVSSDFYFAQEPRWLKEFNDARPAQRYRQSVWTLSAPPEDYRNAARDDLPWERDRYGLGRAFPHDLGRVADEDFHAALRVTPFADELVLAAALAVLEGENLGRGEATDVLAVGFSARDYVGHAFGPESLEAEDQLARVDRLVGRLLDAVDAAVGLDRTLVVLTSDHGAPPAPEALVQYGFSVGRLDGDDLAWALERHLAARFEAGGPFVRGFMLPAVYLDEQAVRDAGLEPAAVERAAADFLGARRGVHAALARADLLAGRLPADEALVRVARAFHPERSGHVVVVPEPGWYLGGGREDNASTHGSPWAYDTHVPVFVAGPGIRPGRIARRVAVEDLAPTLSQLLSVAVPSASVGRPVPELAAGR